MSRAGRGFCAIELGVRHVLQELQKWSEVGPSLKIVVYSETIKVIRKILAVYTCSFGEYTGFIPEGLSP